MYDRSERITKLRADVPGYELSVKVKEARYLVTSPFFFYIVMACVMSCLIKRRLIDQISLESITL